MEEFTKESREDYKKYKKKLQLDSKRSKVRRLSESSSDNHMPCKYLINGSVINILHMCLFSNNDIFDF